MVSKLRRPSSDEIGMWSEVKLYNKAGGRIARAIFDKYRRKGLIYGC